MVASSLMVVASSLMVAASSLVMMMVVAGRMMGLQSLLGQGRNRSPHSPLTDPVRAAFQCHASDRLRTRVQSPVPQPPRSWMRRYGSLIRRT
jgi:hypothetical protein